jgi:hypothetical protein
MHSIVTVPAQPPSSDEGPTRRVPATTVDRAAGSRARELLAMLAALIVVAGVGALMVACTQL